MPTAALATLLAGGEPPAPVGAAHPVVELGRGGPATRGRATASRPRRTALRRAIGAACAAAVLGLAAVLASMPSGDDVGGHADRRVAGVEPGPPGRRRARGSRAPRRPHDATADRAPPTERARHGADGAARGSGPDDVRPQRSGAAEPAQHRPRRRRPPASGPPGAPDATADGPTAPTMPRSPALSRRGQPDPAGRRRQRRRRLGRRQRLVGRGLRRRRHRARVAGRRRRRGVGRLSPTSAG